MTIGGRTGNALLDMGATGSAVASETFGTEGGSLPLDPPWPAGAHFDTGPMARFAAPPGGQMARIGTDILAQRVVTFHYDADPPFAIVGTLPCQPGPPMHAVSLPGAFGVSHRADLPNVPAVMIAIGPLTVPAQIDTGFDDEQTPGIVQANQALIDALRAAGVVMAPAPAGMTAGCAGSKANDRFQVAAAPLAVAGRRFPPPLIEAKSDTSCGGISRFTQPWAQLGASWLLVWGVSVFDGPNGQVLLPR